MSDTLPMLLRRLEFSAAPLIDFDDVETWPKGEVERYAASGLLAPAAPAQTLLCPVCGEREEVIWVDISALSFPFLSCSSGAVAITSDRLHRWQLSIGQLCDCLFAGTGLVGPRQKLVRDRLWRLGKWRLAGTTWNVFFGRALHRRDAPEIVSKVKLPPRSVLFVPSRVPAKGTVPNGLPVVLTVAETTIWNGKELVIDLSDVESRLAAIPASRVAARSPLPKRASRTALIEALQKALEEHLRAARDYAVATTDRYGTPELLPRPTFDLLARQLGVHKSSISRCLDDETAGQVRFLWDLAADLDRLLAGAGLHA